MPAHHAEQCALADARSREEPDALPFRERQDGIERANAGLERALDGPPRERRGRLRTKRRAPGAPHERPTVERSSERIDHASQHLVADLGLRLADARAHAGTRRNTGRRAERRCEQALVTEADHLERHVAGGRDDVELASHRHVHAFHFHELADHLLHATFETHERQLRHLLRVAAEIDPCGRAHEMAPMASPTAAIRAAPVTSMDVRPLAHFTRIRGQILVDPPGDARLP